MKEREPRAVIRATKRKELLLAHIVAAVAGADDDMDLHALIRLQARLLKWDRQMLLIELRNLVKQEQVSVSDGALPSPESTSNAGDEAVYLRIGRGFDPAQEAALAGVATWLVDSDGSSPATMRGTSKARRNAVDVTARRKLVMDELRDASRHEAVHTATLAEALRNNAEFAPFVPGKDVTKPALEATRTQENSLKRLIQRDLQALIDTGDAELSGSKYQASRTRQLNNLTTPAALLMLQRLAEDVFPPDMKEKLEGIFQAARKNLDQFTDANQPENRWIKSLRIVSSHHDLDEPVIDQEVKNFVHEAIYHKRRVELEAAASAYAPGNSYPETHVFKSTGSISHLILEVPGRLSIEFWPQGHDAPTRVRLADIRHIRITKEPAKWPLEHEPESVPSHWTVLAGDAYTRDDGKAQFVLRARTSALEQFRTREIGRIMETEEDDEGWHWVRFRARATPVLLRYLASVPDIVVLRPISESHATRYRMHHSLADQEACHPQMLRLRLEERHQEGYSEQYLAALERSAEWQACPSLIEFLVDRVYFRNPFGYQPDEVGDHIERGQCLAIASSVYRKIASAPVPSRRDLASLLEKSTTEHLQQRSVSCDWDALADECWDALTDHHIYATSHFVYR